MVNLTINGQKISVSEGTTILEAALKVGIDIPHLCYLKDINEIGACRVCVVENAGMETLVTACNTPVEEGMELYTNSPKAREARRINVDSIFVATMRNVRPAYEAVTVICRRSPTTWVF